MKARHMSVAGTSLISRGKASLCPSEAKVGQCLWKCNPKAIGYDLGCFMSLPITLDISVDRMGLSLGLRHLEMLGPAVGCLVPLLLLHSCLDTATLALLPCELATVQNRNRLGVAPSSMTLGCECSEVPGPPPNHPQSVAFPRKPLEPRIPNDP